VARAGMLLLLFVTANCAIGLIPALLAAQGRRETKTHQIGVLTDNAPHSLFAEGFRGSLRDLGYVEGQNLAIDWRSTEGRSAPLNDLASELVGSKVDVIVATYPAAAFAAKRATTTIPIVMVHTPDPVQLGLVASLARPGGNVTGLTSLSADLSTKQLELLKEAVPLASRVAVLWNPGNPWHPIAVKGLAAGGRALKLQLQMVPVQGPGEFQNAFATMRKERAQAVLLLADPVTYVHRKRLADLAISHRLSSMAGPREFAEAGSLLSYWANSTDLSRQTASYVDKILKGARPEDLPIEQPTQYELVVNLKTAKTLALTIPSSLLLRATTIE
jgi:putative tryptophan/tyrosine transport system substrate-binding protein